MSVFFQTGLTGFTGWIQNPVIVVDMVNVSIGRAGAPRTPHRPERLARRASPTPHTTDINPVQHNNLVNPVKHDSPPLFRFRAIPASTPRLSVWREMLRRNPAWLLRLSVSYHASPGELSFDHPFGFACDAQIIAKSVAEDWLNVKRQDYAKQSRNVSEYHLLAIGVYSSERIAA